VVTAWEILVVLRRQSPSTAFLWRRGHAEDGEPVHIIVGGGSVPVRVANELVADAFAKAVLHDGTRDRDSAPARPRAAYPPLCARPWSSAHRPSSPG